MITEALDGNLDSIEFENHPIFGVSMPTSCPNVPSDLLNPINTWDDKNAYEEKANELANKFNKNFEKFVDQINFYYRSKKDGIIKDSNIFIECYNNPIKVIIRILITSISR